MHVHVNVASSKVPGSILTPASIANVFVAFAKFQLVIDEMLSPSRPDNHYTSRLFLGSCANNTEECSKENPCNCAKRFFRQIHAYVNDVVTNQSSGNVDEFCNAALALPDDPSPCKQRYPDQRYFALNLVPLSRLGTIEFRAHSSTYDVERMQRWTQFVIAFVEHFGTDAPHAGSMFFDGSAEMDLEELARAQQEATAEELFAVLGDKVSSGTQAYFAGRSWEDGAVGCSASVTSRLNMEESLKAFEQASNAFRSMGDQISIESLAGNE